MKTLLKLLFVTLLNVSAYSQQINLQKLPDKDKSVLFSYPKRAFEQGEIIKAFFDFTIKNSTVNTLFIVTFPFEKELIERVVYKGDTSALSKYHKKLNTINRAFEDIDLKNAESDLYIAMLLELHKIYFQLPTERKFNIECIYYDYFMPHEALTMLRFQSDTLKGFKGISQKIDSVLFSNKPFKYRAQLFNDTLYPFLEKHSSQINTSLWKAIVHTKNYFVKIDRNFTPYNDSLVAEEVKSYVRETNKRVMLISPDHFVAKKQYGITRTFAARLNEDQDSPLKGQVLSVSCLPLLALNKHGNKIISVLGAALFSQKIHDFLQQFCAPNQNTLIASEILPHDYLLKEDYDYILLCGTLHFIGE